MVDFCTFHELRNNEQFSKQEEIYKFAWEARGHKSNIDYFKTSTKILNIIQDIRVYRRDEIGSDHYLLCPEVNFPPRWLNKSNKKNPLKQEEFFNLGLLNNNNNNNYYYYYYYYKRDQFVSIVKSQESTQPNINSIIKTAAKITEELSQPIRRMTQNRMEYNT